MARSSLPKGYVTVPLGALVKAKWNYKKDDKDLTAALTRNVKRNGQVENIVIRRLGKEKWEVVNGNHRIDAFRAAGFTEVVAYDLGTVSLAIAKRIAVELNETRFPTDQIDLAKILVGLKKELGLEQLDGLPFTPVDLENMEGLLGFDWEGSGQEALRKGYYMVLVKAESPGPINAVLRGTGTSTTVNKDRRRVEVFVDRNGKRATR